MTPEQTRIVKAEMIRYGVEQKDVAAAIGVDPSAVSHVVSVGDSGSERIKAMIGRMILGKRLNIDLGDVPEKAIAHWVAEFFPKD